MLELNELYSKSIQDVTRLAYMHLFTELQKYDKITINNAAIEQLNNNTDARALDNYPQWPYGLHHDYEWISDVLLYDGVRINVQLVNGAGEVKARFPTIRMEYYWISGVYDHARYAYGKNAYIHWGQKYTEVHASSFDSIKGFYEQLAKAHKRYISRLKKAEAENAKQKTNANIAKKLFGQMDIPVVIYTGLPIEPKIKVVKNGT